MRSHCRLLVAALLVGCTADNKSNAAAGSTARATSVPAANQTAASAKPACPANGQWSDCAVFDRLDHAGLAPRRDSTVTSVELPPLAQRGTRLLLGNAEMDVFIFPDVSTREREEARLDKSQYIEATDEPTLRGEATLIRNANLLAVLHSRNDHQRERVSDALSAGPPQRASGTLLPTTKSR